MGELSKKIGERGEEIVEYLFTELLGYKHYRTGISIDCVNEKEHTLKKGSERRTHGIDGLVSYKTPLTDNCLEIGLISSKYTNNPYPNSQLRNKFKEHFKDIAWTIECFQYSQQKANIESNVSGVEKTRIIGVLFWLSNHDDSKNQDTTPETSKAQLGGLGLKYDQIIYVDNSRMEFLVNILEPLKRSVGRENYTFVYPDTGFNLRTDIHKGFGEKFPIPFFSYDIIPIRIQKNDSIILYLACRKKFDPSDFKKIIGLAKSFNQLQATSKTLIGFPNYNASNHDSEVKEVLSSIIDEDFTSQIDVVNHNPDFRNLKI